MTNTFSIVFQHEDFIIVDKSADINFHDEDEKGMGLFSQIKQQFSGENLFPVHRLDKMTSGLLIVAKSLSCAQEFQQLFTQRQVEKFYLALSDVKPKKKQGLIIGDMAKSRRGTWKLLRTKENPAITQFFSYALSNKTRLFCLKPHTGKTHQIRVALASIGAPIIGDNYYHTKPSGTKQQTNDNELVADRGYLHAYCLKFTYQGEAFAFRSAPNSGQLFLTPQCQQQLTELDDPATLPWPNVPRHNTNGKES
ncbi:TIGR01621 family pseudouridine synthase [Thalassotalea fusca]